MDISGKIIQVLPLQTGAGKNGTWQKQDYVLETTAQYPKKICFSVWGDKVSTFDIKQGMSVKVSFDLESREYNGKWYTDVRAWKVESEGSSNTSFKPDDTLLNDASPDDILPF